MMNEGSARVENHVVVPGFAATRILVAMRFIGGKGHGVPGAELVLLAAHVHA